VTGVQFLARAVEHLRHRVQAASEGNPAVSTTDVGTPCYSVMLHTSVRLSRNVLLTQATGVGSNRKCYLQTVPTDRPTVVTIKELNDLNFWYISIFLTLSPPQRAPRATVLSYILHSSL
jgi:hypothetical protein